MADGLQPAVGSRKQSVGGAGAGEVLQSINSGFALGGMCPVSLANPNPCLKWRAADGQVVSWQVRSASPIFDATDVEPAKCRPYEI